MDNLTKTLQKRSKNLVETSARVSEETRDAAASFGNQANDLTAASARASAISDDLKQTAKENGTDDFLRRVKYVSEALQSLAVDINRLMENRVSEDDWKRFSGGDRGIFLRKIAGMRDRGKLTAINRRHREDSDFREYVDRYISQFDELMARVKRSDLDGVLGATFLTSDIGKVYMILTRALED